MKTQKQRIYERIISHGQNLLALFPEATERDPVQLCKKLRRIEGEAERAAIDYCNGVIDADAMDAAENAALAKLESLLGFTRAGVPVFINRDPRGYALKIEDSWVRGYTGKGGKIDTDWGGYGILAPDLTND